MPDTTAPSSGKEQAPPNKEDGQEKVEPKNREIKVEEDTSQKTKSKKEQDKEKRRKEFEEELKEKEKKLKEAGKKPSVKYKDIAESIEAIDAVQDEKGVFVNPTDVAEFHTILTKYGAYSEREAQALKLSEMVVAVQMVLRHVDIGEPTQYDLRCTPEEFPDRLKVAHATVRKIQSEEEETLTVGKAREYVELDKHGSRVSGRGVGTMITGMPDRDAIVDPKLRVFVEDIEDIPDDIDPDEILAQLKSISLDLRRSVSEGVLNPDDDAQVNEVRNSLKEHVNKVYKDVKVIRDLQQEEYQWERNMKAFDEAFGKDFSDTLKYFKEVSAENSIELYAALKDVNKTVEDVLDVGKAPGFKPDKEETWPEDVNVKKVFEVCRAVVKGAGLVGRKNFIGMLKDGGATDEEARALVNVFLNPDHKINVLEKFNTFYRNIYDNFPEVTRAAIAKDIETSAQLATDSIAAGWVKFSPRMKELYDLTFGENQEKFKPVLQTLKEWRGSMLINSVELNLKIVEIMKAPPDWQDAPRVYGQLMAYIESTGASPDVLQPVLQALQNVLQHIPLSNEHERAVFGEQKELLEAFKMKHTLFLTAHSNELNPEKMGHVFEAEMNGVKEDTFEKIIARFEKDAQGRAFYVISRDVNGELLEAPVKINLFDVGKKLYSERLRDDKIHMNMVEELSKHAITERFTGVTLAQMKKSAMVDSLPPEWQAKWEDQLDETRKKLVERYEALIEKKIEDTRKALGKNPGDPRLTKDLAKFESMTIDSWANNQVGGDELDLTQSLTKEVIQSWYETKTLHGAFGLAKPDDFGEFGQELDDHYVDYKKRMVAEYGRNPGGFLDYHNLTEFEEMLDENQKEYKHKMHESFEEATNWLDIRRTQMRQTIKEELSLMGLKYDTSIHFGKKGEKVNLRDVDLDELLTSGYINSLEINLYELTWIYEWSTYEFIHIYGRKPSQFKDDYKALVQTRYTDGYYAKLIDHNWEYLHPDFEDRGRGRENDVNQIFMQYFPGKHHWIFGHVSVGSRFIEKFLDERGKTLVELRTDQLVKDHDFHNEKYEGSFRSYMRGVAVRELMAAGAISFADGKYSDVVKEKDTFNKFNPIDNADDRKRLLGFIGAGNLQELLANPEFEKFLEITGKDKVFPSTRDPRLFPWMEFGVRAFRDVVSNHKYRLFKDPNISSGRFENFVKTLVSTGRMEDSQGEKFIKKELGMGPGIFSTKPFRELRAIWEEKDEKTQRDRGRYGWIPFLVFLFWSPLKELFKSAFNEAKK